MQEVRDMHQSTESHRTAKNLSPEEIRRYRAKHQRSAKTKQLDEPLLQRAWQTAHRVAGMLYEDFGATQVAVFGSLAEKDSFSKWSDIDIAVCGIPAENYLRALSEAENVSRLFKVDLIEFENCGGLFRHRVSSQAIRIAKGETYHVDRSHLIRRISDERAKIGETVKKIGKRLEKIETAPVEYREEIETAIGKNLTDCYRGMEDIFKRIALDVDLRMPDGSMWHKELLTQVAEPQAERPAVISAGVYAFLQELLEFRHVFNNIYQEELIYEKTEHNARRIGDIFVTLSEELDTFIDFLDKRDSDSYAEGEEC